MGTDFLSVEEIAGLTRAIREAEAHSSGEIRIHIDHEMRSNYAQTALKVFFQLDMENTQNRNGVLFYVNFSHRYLTIIGDKAIHEKVTQGFWDYLHDKITRQFAEGHYFEPLQTAVLETGQELKKYFPLGDTNPNELPDDISFS